MIRRNARKKPPAEVFCGQFALLLIPIGELKIALHKYTVHVIDMGNIKAAEIKPGNGIAVIEHTGHICYLGSIEMTEIQLCQGFAGKNMQFIFVTFCVSKLLRSRVFKAVQFENMDFMLHTDAVSKRSRLSSVKREQFANI